MKEYEIIIILLFLKHFLFDFVLQNQKQTTKQRQVW